MRQHCVQVNRGVALVQVLLLSAILMAVLLTAHMEARRHIKSAELAVDRALSAADLQTRESEILFALLTESRKSQPDSSDPLLQHWNFTNFPFQVVDNRIESEVAIQDQAALVALNSPQSLLPVLTLITQDPVKSQQLVAAIEDWQDQDDIPKFGGAEQKSYPASIRVRNAPIQHIDELLYIKGMTTEIYQQLKPLVTLFPKRFQNLYAMDAVLLKSYVDPVRVEQILAERQQGTLTPERFAKLSGIEQDEFISFAPGNGLRVRFTVFGNDVKLSRQFSVTVNPSADDPLEFWDYKKYIYDNF
jgi:general secretion pathway protein K